jgi:hypothetical protein
MIIIRSGILSDSHAFGPRVNSRDLSLTSCQNHMHLGFAGNWAKKKLCLAYCQTHK